MLSEKDKARITQDFLDGSFYNNLLKPYLDERAETVAANAHHAILKAEGDKEFIQNSGRLNELADLEGQLKSWASADVWLTKKS
jgi:hypothetical protein